MKPREFWIKNGFLDPVEGVIRLTEPVDFSKEYFTHVREVVPIDWDNIWVSLQANIIFKKITTATDFRKNVQELIEKQLKGEE